MNILVLLGALIGGLLATGSSIAAEPYLVLQWTQNTRIVLSKQECIVPNLKGARAVVQRLEANGSASYIKGCWSNDPNNPEHIRIDWEPSNYSKGKADFAVIEMAKFTYIEQ